MLINIPDIFKENREVLFNLLEFYLDKTVPSLLCYNFCEGGGIMAKKNMNELKKRALLAKQRMKMGYWEQMMKDREKLISEVGSTYEAQKLVSDYQRDKYNREYNITVSRSASQDEQLYEKVRVILDSEELVINPIARLIDKNEYDKMDNEAKQRYVLELSKKFRELKERYNRERMNKSS